MASLFAALLTARAHAHDPSTPRVAAIVMHGVDGKVLDTVESLGVPLSRRSLAAESSDSQVISQALRFPEPLVLWIDSARSTISVLRTDDGTALSRMLAHDTFTETPYVAALAATELIELMQKTPAARVEVPLPTADERGVREARPAVAASAFAGAGLAAGASRGPALFRPVLGVDAIYRLSESVFTDVGIVAMPYAVATDPLPREGDGRVRYQRADLALRLGLGAGRGRASALAYLSTGMGFVRVEAQGIDDERERTKHRKQLLAGGGAVFRYFVWDRVGVSFGVDVAWLTTPARYLVDGAVVLHEDSLRIGGSLSLLVRLR